MEIIKRSTTTRDITIFSNDYCVNSAMINEFQTSFFTLKINKIELIKKELGGYVIDDDAQYLVVNVSIRNITNEVLLMLKEDFTISYDDEEPYVGEDFFQIDKQLPNEYALKPNERITGKLIFIIGGNAKRIMLMYNEFYDDDSEGKTYKLKYIIQ
ncbi:MAG: DUF4352 domain-containing protein [Erysipelotrichaceae bacterium]